MAFVFVYSHHSKNNYLQENTKKRRHTIHEFEVVLLSISFSLFIEFYPSKTQKSHVYGTIIKKVVSGVKSYLIH